MTARTALAALAAILVLAFAGCEGVRGEPTEAPVEVKVTLDEFNIVSSVTRFTEGVPYRFVITNAGQTSHEFLVGPIPSKDRDRNGGTPDAHHDALVGVGEETLKPGTTATLEYTFADAAGDVEFACHLPGHYEGGMRLPIVVE